MPTSGSSWRRGGKTVIATIDGPAGVGKSSVAKEVARRVDFQLLDTGAMYRALTLAAMRNGVDLQDGDAVIRLARRTGIVLESNRVLLDGHDVTKAIRTSDVTANVRPIADNDAVRMHLVQLQRRLAAGRNMVTEGRDQGTLAFPDAECKVFLVASAETRAERRLIELRQQGEDVTLQDVLRQQNQRDLEDESRKFGRLKPAVDATIIETDGLDLQQVVDRVEQLIRQCIDQESP